jgi:SAM-dependent methyltransferase
MRLAALDHWVCPITGSPLSVEPFETKQFPLSGDHAARAQRMGLDQSRLQPDVKEGVLYGEPGGYWYPIVNHVPVLMDHAIALHEDFKNKYKEQSFAIRDRKQPDKARRPGEDIQQRVFTREWNTLAVDDLSFGLDPDQRDKFITTELEWDSNATDTLPLIFEAGCGSGFEARSLDRVTKGYIFGIDMNLTVIRNGATHAINPFTNLAVASIFAIPVRSKAFDIVYSSGALHHTYSTKHAFNSILKARKDDGQIYIWVYALEDMAKTKRRRAEFSIEEIVRPRIAQMSERWQSILVRALAEYQCRRYRKKGPYNKDKWQLHNAEHEVRDRWTVRYAHRHSFHEVISWYVESQLDYKLVDPVAYFDRLKVPFFGIGIRGYPRGSIAAQLDQ